MAIEGECKDPVDGGVVPEASGSPPVEASVPPSKPDVTAMCTVRRLVAERKGLNLYLLIDASPSILLRPLWMTLNTAVKRFVEDPANYGLGLGVGYYGSSCSPDAYTTPTVPIRELPDVADEIMRSFPLPLNGKASAPALAGSLNYVRSVIRSDASRETSIVLMSDNFGDLLCGSFAEDVAVQARAGLEADPPVKTHVVALGVGSISIPDPFALASVKPLDDVAAAGGTGTATRILVSESADVEIADGLKRAVVKATPCAYRVPTTMERPRTSIEWADGLTAAPVVWPFVPESACGDAMAAYVAIDEPGYAVLCPAACEAVRARPEGVLRFREDCDPSTPAR